MANRTGLDPEPIARYLQTVAPGRSDLDLSRMTGVPARRFYALRSGSRIALDTADRITLALGSAHDLNELYPLEAS